MNMAPVHTPSPCVISHLDPASKLLLPHPGGPPQCVEQVGGRHLYGGHLQQLQVFHGGRQAAQQLPHDAEVVLDRTCLLGKTETGWISKQVSLGKQASGGLLVTIKYSDTKQ